MIKFEGKKRNVFFCSNSCVYGTCGKLHSMILFNNKKRTYSAYPPWVLLCTRKPCTGSWLPGSQLLVKIYFKSRKHGQMEVKQSINL